MPSANSGAHGAAGQGQQLGSLIEQVWDRGWEPVDLHRVAVRDGNPVATSLLGDLVAANLAGYPAVTVDHRWHAQLEEIGASVWWGPGEDPVAARAARVKGGWAAVTKAAAVLELTLRLLQPIEQLSPRPGRATTSSAPREDVDERLLTKVRMMLAKAEATTFPAEAETFTAAAQKLMTRHSIDRAMLDQSSPSAEGPAAIRVGVDRPYESARFKLVATIAQANRCKAVWHKGLGFSTVVGFPADLRAVELLFTSLMVQATTAMTAQGSREDWAGASRTRSFRNSFLTAFAVRIGERLVTAASEAQDEGADAWDAEDDWEDGDDRDRWDDWDDEDDWDHEGGDEDDARARRRMRRELTDRPGRTPSDRTALVRVLAERDQAVEDAVSERFPRLRSTRSRAVFDEEGWASGTSAADRADLGTPGRLQSPG